MKRRRSNNDNFSLMVSSLHLERFFLSAVYFSRIICRLALSVTVRSGFMPVIGISVLDGDGWAQTKFGTDNPATMLIKSTIRIMTGCSAREQALIFVYGLSLKLRMYAMRLSASSSLITRFGIVLCEVFSAALSAAAVIPGTFAILANVGAFSFVERPFSFTVR
jgi:hypothetical protein